MQGRPTGHQIDPLAIIVGLEEQVNESSQRIDNAVRNLTDLAKAVRSLVGKVEELQHKLEEKHAGPDLMYPHEVHSETILELQTEQSALLQRIDDLEQRALPAAANADYAKEFQRTEADVEALRLQFVQLQDKMAEQDKRMTQRMTEFARKYPEGQLAKYEDIERLGSSLDKLAKEQSRVEDRFKEFSHVKESSALLTILRTEHSALQRRLENLEATGVAGGGDAGPLLDDLHRQIDKLTKEQDDLRELAAKLQEANAEQPDVRALIRAAITPVREQLETLEAREPAEAVDSSADVARMEATLAGLSKQQETQAAALAELRSALERVDKVAAEGMKPSPEMIEAAASVKHFQAQLEKLTQEQVGLRERVESVATLGMRIGVLEARELPEAKDYSAELAQLRDSLTALDVKYGELAARELPETVDHSSDLAGLRESLTSLEAKHSDLAARELPEVVDHSAELAGLREAITALNTKQAVFAEALGKVEGLEIPEAPDHTRELEDLRAGMEALNEQQRPLLKRIAELEAREVPAPVDHSAELAELRAAIEKLGELHAPLHERITELAAREIPIPIDHSTDLAEMNRTIESLSSQHTPLLARVSELEARELPQIPDHTATLAELQESIHALQVQQTSLQTRIGEVGSREIPAPIDHSFEIAELKAAINNIAEQHAGLQSRIGEVASREQPALPDHSEELSELRTTTEVVAEQQASLLTRITQLETRELPQAADYSADIARIQSVLDKLAQQEAQVEERLARFADQAQISKLMETLSELQMRLARNSEQLVSMEQTRNQGQEEQRKQLQNQLDIQERQRALLEEIQVKLEVQDEQITAQQSQLAELMAQAREAAEKKRRASDEPHADPTMGSLIEGALHIERGEYAEAVRCLEAARALGDNPKIDQALALARKMLEQKK